MENYTIRYAESIAHSTIIKANSEEEARKKFYENSEKNVKYAILTIEKIK